MKEMTQEEAWLDFERYITDPARWAELSPRDRNTILVAKHTASGRVVRNGRHVKLGIKRLMKILTAHAPGRYVFKESIYCSL